MGDSSAVDRIFPTVGGCRDRQRRRAEAREGCRSGGRRRRTDGRARALRDAGTARSLRGHDLPTGLAVRRQVRDRPRPCDPSDPGARAAPVVRRLRQRVQAARRLLRGTEPARGTSNSHDGPSVASPVERRAVRPLQGQMVGQPHEVPPPAGDSLGGRAHPSLLGPRVHRAADAVPVGPQDPGAAVGARPEAHAAARSAQAVVFLASCPPRG